MTSTGHVNPRSGQPSKAWKDAINHCSSKLSPEQKAKVQYLVKAEDCIAYINKLQNEPKRLSKVLRIFLPIIEPLKRFEGAIDVVVATNSGMGSPIWAPLRLVVTLVHDHFDTLERLLLVLEQLTTSLDRYTGYEALFETDERVERGIRLLYIDLLDLMVDLIVFHSKPLKRLFGTFDGSFGQVSKRIQFHSQELDWIANSASMHRSEADRQASRRAQEDFKLSQSLGWLHPCSVRDDIDGLSAQIMTGSCDWILKTPEIQSFLQDSDGHLTITGSPGSGKSTIAAFLVDNLRSSSDKLVFFCDGNNAEKRSALSCMRTLVAQKLRADSNANEQIHPHFLKSGRPIADSWEQLMPCLSVLEGSFIIIDAVDECGDHQKLYEVLGCLKAKIILTTRPPRVENAQVSISTPFTTAFLANENSKMTEHVNQYIAQRVDEFPVDFRCRIQDHVPSMCASAAGLWLYACLLLDEINRAPTSAAAVRLAQNHPKGLEAMYDNIFKSMFEQMTPEQRTMAGKIMLWIDESNYIPEDLGSTDNGVLIETLNVVVAYANYGESLPNPVEFALNICVPLLRKRSVQVEQVHGSYKAEEVCFFHPTLGDHLKNNPGLFTQLELPPFRSRAETAMWYFSECPDSEDRLKVYRRVLETTKNVNDCPVGPYISMSYALEGLMLVVKDSRKFSKSNSLLTEFCDSRGGSRWLEMALIFNYLGGWKRLEDNFERINTESKSSIVEGITGCFLGILWLTAPWNDVHGPTIAFPYLRNQHLMNKDLLCTAIKIRRSMSIDMPISRLSDEMLEQMDLETIILDVVPAVKSSKTHHFEWNMDKRSIITGRRQKNLRCFN